MLWSNAPFPGDPRAWVAFLLLAAGACGSSSTEPPPQPGVQVIAGGGQDTIGTLFAQGIVVEVRDSVGLAAAESVLFESIPGSTTAHVLLASDEGPFGAFAASTTNERGRAVAFVRNGLIAGEVVVRIQVPGFGFDTLITYTILPGNPELLRVRDTVVGLGGRITPIGLIRDRGGNQSTVPGGSLTLTALTPMVRVQGGQIEGVAVGNGRVAASFVGADAVFSVRVVPSGTIGMTGFGQEWVVTRTDGRSDPPVPLPVMPMTANPSPVTGDVVMDDLQIIESQLRILNRATGDVRVLTSSDPRHEIQLYPKFSFDGSWIYLTDVPVPPGSLSHSPVWFLSDRKAMTLTMPRKTDSSWGSGFLFPLYLSGAVLLN